MDGGSLAEKLDGTPWPGRQAARLVEDLARAMDYAHRRRVIHRDLKPANVLLAACGVATSATPQAIPKITDFGLAKQVGSQKGQTQTGAILGTPGYMAPEQAGGHPHDVGPAADVYALGAILYELLTGRPPFRAETPLDTVLQVVSEEPVPPRRLHSRVPRKLGTVCLKCLEKTPARRYASAGELADDLARFGAGEPIRARPVGPLGRGWRWCKRKPLVAGLGGTVALLLLLAAAAGPWLAQYRATLRAREREDGLARERAEEKAAAQEREARAAQERADQSAAQSIGLAHREWTFHNVKGAEELLDQCPERFRGWEWNYLKGLCHAELLTLRGHAGPVAYAAFLGDGQAIVSAGADQTARTWDALTGQPTRALGLRVGTGVAFGPDGRFLVSAPLNDVKDIHVWDVRANREHLTLRGHGAQVSAAAFAADGRHLVSADTDKVVKVWDVTAGDCLHTLRGHPETILSVALSPDGRTVLAGGLEGTGPGKIKFWDPTTGQVLLTLSGHSAPVSSLAFSPDGTRLVSATASQADVATIKVGELKVWDVAAGTEVLNLKGHRAAVSRVVFSPDGKRVASSSLDGTVRLWDAAGGECLRTLGAGVAVMGLAFSPDGRRGELAKVPGADWVAAVARPRIDPLPSTAEVRFDCWSPDAVNCEAYLHAADEAHGLLAVLMGSKNQWVVNGPQGVSVALQSGKTLFQEVAFSQKVRMERNRHYRVRVLREPRRLNVFVDGVEVASAPPERVPELDLPNLRLQASLGQPGSVIYFDNVEVRAPPAALQEQQARALVARLFDQFLLRADVTERLRGDAALSEPVRKLALQMAETHPEDAKKLTEAAWDVVNDPSAGRSAHEKALRRAEAACRLSPDNWQNLVLLGNAQYRVGRYEDALRTLTRSIEPARADFGSAVPRQYAFRAMAHHRLGQAAEARADFVRLRDLMKGTSWAGKDTARHVYAKRVYREAEALLRDSLKEDAADREKEIIKDTVFKAVQAGWVDHDLKAHLALFTDDARSIGGRAEEPGPADVVTDRKRIEALRPLQIREPPDGMTSSYEDVRVDISNDQAVLRCRSVGQWDDNFVTLGVAYRLRRTPQGWKAYEERGWVLAQKFGPRVMTFDAAFYRERDAQVEKLRGAGDRREVTGALAEARRFAEALAVARELTAAGATAADWALRGELAFRAGDPDDTLASFRRAQRIDPEVELPRYVSRELRTFRGHAGPVFGAAFNDDGTRLASGGDDRTVKVWDTTTGKELRTLRGHTGRISGVAYSPDGRRIASAAMDNTVKMWDAATGEPLRTLTGHTGRVYRVAFSPYGRRIVSASADRTARVWDAETSRLILTLSGHEKDVLGAMFSPDGLHVATASHDKKVKIWDAGTGREERTLEGHAGGLLRVAYSPDGKRLASASADQTVKLWDAATGKEMRTLSGHTALVEVVTFSPDGRFLASAGGDRTIKLWDADTGRKLLSLRGHGGRIFALSFSPDGKALASACEDGTVMTWDVTGPDDLRGP